MQNIGKKIIGKNMKKLAKVLTVMATGVSTYVLLRKYIIKRREYYAKSN